MQIMQEGQQDDEEDNNQHHQGFQQQEQFQHDDGQHHGALYNEARKLMEQNDEEPAPQQDDNQPEGPKIKMGRIGKKKKAKAGAKQDDGEKQSDAYQKQIKGLQAVQSSNPGGGFSDQDVEFMKKAI